MKERLSTDEQDFLLKTLKSRFIENMHRHPNLSWDEVEESILKQPEKLWSLYEMERTGGEPDVVGGTIVFMDVVKESPKERRSLCYDKAALESRKKNPPKGDAQTLASDMGIQILTETDYRELQNYEEVDLKTSTWVETPADIRQLGGAIFCDRRYNKVFMYHNSAESYYASRGFRGKVVF